MKKEYPGEGSDQCMEDLELTYGFRSMKVMVTLAGSRGIVIGVGEQKPDWSRLKRECGETNCNEEKKERKEMRQLLLDK